MNALSEFVLQNVWISYISFLIWILSIILIIKIDIGLLRGRGDFKNKKGEFENLGITFLKSIILWIILVLSFVFSFPLMMVLNKGGIPIIIIFIIIVMMAITFLVFIPIRIVMKGPASDFSLRWLINLIDRYDNKKTK